MCDISQAALFPLFPKLVSAEGRVGWEWIEGQSGEAEGLDVSFWQAGQRGSSEVKLMLALHLLMCG